MDLNEYQKQGFVDREEYLKNLAADFGVSYSTVKYLADALGSNEDFDGLVTELEDYANELIMDDTEEDLFG